VRLFCNLVYARLASACPDGESRDGLDRELGAPAGGWDAAERELWRRVNEANARQAGEG
jgi:hypothetical protein